MGRATDEEIGFVVTHDRFRGIEKLDERTWRVRVSDDGHVIIIKGPLNAVILVAAEALRRTGP
jgi:hypothetical protein